MAKISVVVPVYNVELYLNNCVESVLAQTYSDFELILVDDGSTDSSGTICEILKERDNRITVYHKENGGLSDARNYGIDRASGEFITFIDSDDYVAPDYLEYLLSLFDKSESCSVTACNHFVVRNNRPVPESDFDGIAVFNRKDAFERVLYHDVLDVSAWAKLYRMEVFKSLRYPKGRLYEDTYLFGEVINLTENIVYGGKPLYYYIQRQSSIVNSAFNQKKLEYIDSAKRLTDFAIKFDSSLEKGCVRRLSHARLSVLRYMDGCEKQYRPIAKKLRKEILETAPTVIKDKKTPKRDVLAILILFFGLKPFFLIWKLYGKVR